MAELLIENWSYSSLTLFLRERLSFKKKYILKIYDDMSSPSAIVGSAGHKVAEFILNGHSVEEAIAEGLRLIDSISDTNIDYGKTGSREKIIADFTRAMQFFVAEMPKPHELLGVEKRMTHFLTADENYAPQIAGKEFAIPAKSFADVVVRNQAAEIEIWDWKFVKSFTDSDDEKANFIFQALFNYHTAWKEYGERPKRMIFWELKTSENTKDKKGEPQLQPYVIEYSDFPQYFDFFYNLYEACTREIMKPDIQFLPNFNDMFDGKNALQTYMQDLIGFEAPTIAHKTKVEKFSEKNFIASAPDKVENKHLTEEEKIRLKLQEFGIAVEMQDTYRGSSVIQYTLKASRGTKMALFEKLSKDLALVLRATTIRVLAPIMGTDLVGIEVPNIERVVIHLLKDGQMSERAQLSGNSGELKIPVGVNVYGDTVVKDLSDMPHLLIAGATGAGKSVMINVIIRSLIYQNTPEQLKFVLIDPKRVELAAFKHDPRLLVPTIYEQVQAIKALKWLVDEMEDRYTTLEEGGYRNINAYNDDHAVPMSKIVVVIDEFADLILQKNIGEPSYAEQSIVRLAQKARAIGIHIILGTQRPSVDVVTGLIKANLPTRIAFMTSSRTDSQVILDQSGAEELVGKGDMLFLDPSTRGLQRLQGFYA